MDVHGDYFVLDSEPVTVVVGGGGRRGGRGGRRRFCLSCTPLENRTMSIRLPESWESSAHWPSLWTRTSGKRYRWPSSSTVAWQC